jgi:preprotein translocase SecE subunit
MAVAVKNSPDLTTRSWLERLPVASLLGAVYILGSIGVVFSGIPSLWSAYVDLALRRSLGVFVSGALLLVVMLAVSWGLVWLGLRLLGPHPLRGVRAGIFVCSVGLLALALLTCGIGRVLEGVVAGESGALTGAALTGLAALALVVGAVWALFRPRFEKFLVQFEEQGWFSTAPYKRSQGQKVRRGTILGILILAGCGIYTLLAHRSLGSGTENNWELPVPFAAGTVSAAGDVPATAAEGGLAAGEPIHRYELNKLNEQARTEWVKVKDPGSSQFQPRQVVPREQFEETRRALAKAEDQRPPTSEAVTPASARFPTVRLLPHLQFTLPILLALASLWLAYRVVNYPVFADFLIATEAELNKVSWTTRRRLVQDTIVVLTTVLLMTVFLFVVDVAWGWLLSRVGVLQLNPTGTPAMEDRKSGADW